MWRRIRGAWLIPLLVGVIGVGVVVTRPGGGGGSPAFTCDLNATVANFATQVAAATAGQTVCLTESADYGTWTGTNKAITVRAGTGTTPTMVLDFSNGDSDFTLDGSHTFNTSNGLLVTSATLLQTPGPQDITIKNVNFSNNNANGASAVVRIDGPTNSNIIFDHNEWHDIGGLQNGCTEDNNPACTSNGVHLPYDGPSYITFQNNLWRDMAADGAQVGASHTDFINNEFSNVTPGAAWQHTDAIQFCCGYLTPDDLGSGNNIVTGNYFHGSEQSMGSFDGSGNNTITNNVIVQNNAAHWLTLRSGDNPGSLVQHNTLVGTGNNIECSGKSPNPAVTSLKDNITSNFDLNPGGDQTACATTAYTHNMMPSGAVSPNLNGTPTFVGGANPTTWAGFKLAPGSAGENAASDGLDIGIN